LSSFVRYFVTSGSGGRNLRATSQFEALAQSACKKNSGDAMSCVSCHNPHETVTKENRVVYYRAKCVACHGEAFAEKHHASQKDCTSCHMPASLSTDVAHTEVTDHRILRKQRNEPATGEGRAPLEPLTPFPSSEETRKDVRDLALAWQNVAERVSAAQPEAELLLNEALHASPGDAALLSALAYIDQRRGETQQASALYEQALKMDPTSVDAATDLGVLDASQDRLAEAVKLWQPAFERAPERSAIGMNLAHAFCSASQFTEARNYVLRVLRFNPDLGSAKKLLRELNSTPPRCGP
jgi:Flp pilus assembly protein TadD